MSKTRFVVGVMVFFWAGCAGEDAPEGSIGARVDALKSDIASFEQLVDGHAMAMHDSSTLEEMNMLMEEYMPAFEQRHRAIEHAMEDMHQCSHGGQSLDMTPLEDLMESMSEELERHRMHADDDLEGLRDETTRHVDHMLELMADVGDEAGRYRAREGVMCPHHGPHGSR